MNPFLFTSTQRYDYSVQIWSQPVTISFSRRDPRQVPKCSRGCFQKKNSHVPFGGFTHWPFLLRHFSLDNAERAWRTRVRAGSWRWFFRLGRWEKAIATGSGSGSGNWGNESVARRSSYRDIVGLWFPQFPICRLCIRPAIKIHFITPRRTEIHVHTRRSTNRARPNTHISRTNCGINAR